MPRVGLRDSEELSDEASRTLLWAEVLGNITVLRSTPIEEIPSLAEELGVDRVVLASSGHLDSHGCGGDLVERALLTSTKVPLCFISRFMGGSSSDT